MIPRWAQDDPVWVNGHYIEHWEVDYLNQATAAVRSVLDAEAAMGNKLAHVQRWAGGVLFQLSHGPVSPPPDALGDMVVHDHSTRDFMLYDDLAVVYEDRTAKQFIAFPKQNEI